MKYSVVLSAVFVSLVSVAHGGQIIGVTKDLDDNVLSDVSIVVVDLDNGARSRPIFSDTNGLFTVNLPPGTAVGVEFRRVGRDPADLTGISGDVVLGSEIDRFEIFLPKAKCRPYCVKPRCYRSRLCRLRCR